MNVLGKSGGRADATFRTSSIPIARCALDLIIRVHQAMYMPNKYVNRHVIGYSSFFSLVAFLSKTRHPFCLLIFRQAHIDK